ncbi:acyltransferase family protein [Pulveribacter suum]|uniref:Acyltransferase n=1 Tax=Pulveribacter suum TaxID=2116657 RepID=A0A2P1NP64_9BURK|nr:acyltransferase family protein [Pulveribacter suum]AVP58842.1 acyltransferase [Pulveribacter suum]
MRNRFDGLRLVAALSVFISHGLFLYKSVLPVPFPGHSLGSLAVYVFFFISGHLVCQSWAREPQWRAFWRKRALRIFPGLVVAVAFSVFVIGWAVTTLPAADYLRAPLTWLNLANNAAALATVQTLPGVFEHNPFARAVNGSLWTIRYELLMYLVLALLAWGARGRRWLYPAMACALALLWMLARWRGWDAAIEAQLGLVADVFRWRDFCGFGVPFFIGSACAAYRVRPHGWMAAAALAAAACAALVDGGALRQMAVWAFIALGTFYAAFAGRPRMPALGHERVDLSYGIYIYAFPVQQAVTELSLRHGWSLAMCMALSLALVVPLALLSWFAVERPGIRLARRRRAAALQAPAAAS